MSEPGQDVVAYAGLASVGQVEIPLPEPEPEPDDEKEQG